LKPTIRKAESLLESDPVGVVMILRDAADCDEKFALLYYADIRIARNADGGFFYHDKINPRGWYDKKPNQYEQEIIQNPVKGSSLLLTLKRNAGSDQVKWPLRKIVIMPRAIRH